MDLIISDLDGTLICNDLIPQNNIDSINQWIEYGNDFWIATGRSLCEANKYLDKMRKISVAILNNGAQIYFPKSKQIIHTSLFDKKTIKQTISILEENNSLKNVILYGKFNYVINGEKTFYREISKWKTNYYIAETISDLFEKDFFKILLYKPDSRILKELSDLQVNIIENTNNTIELIPLNTDKGTAVLKAFSIFKDLKYNKVYVFGDGCNDLSLKFNNNILISVKSANKDLIRISDYVGCEASQGILKFFLEKIYK